MICCLWLVNIGVPFTSKGEKYTGDKMLDILEAGHLGGEDMQVDSCGTSLS